jgi:hypothetical protein
MTEERCCARCRLIQPRAEHCAHCGGELLDLVVDWKRLIAQPVVGVGTEKKAPPKGWRDALALTATIAGMFGGMIVGGIIHEMLALPLGVAAVAFGYRKQFWRAVLKRRPRVAAVPPLAAPQDVGVAGIAERWQETVAGEPGGALVVQLVVWAEDGVLFRRLDAVPFAFLPESGTRGLVTGVCALPLDRGHAEPVREARELGMLQARLGLPKNLQFGPGLLVERRVVRAGDRVSVGGEVREEVVAGLGGYRDAGAEVRRGEPGQPIWIRPAVGA